MIGTLSFPEGTALLVGVGGDLPGTADDAKAIRDLLVDKSRCGYPPERTQLLTGAEATATAILAGIERLATAAQPDSTVIIYFSGHGARIQQPEGWRYYLVPHGCNAANLAATAVAGDAFVARLQAIQARKMLLVLDCCHAGGFELSKAVQIEKAPLPAPVEMLRTGTGLILLASSQPDEVSYAGRPYSQFTVAFMEALCGKGASREDGFVRAADIALYTREAVTNRTRQRQHPILDFSAAENFRVAYYAGGAAQKKALPFPTTPYLQTGDDGPFEPRSEVDYTAPTTYTQNTYNGPVQIQHDVFKQDRWNVQNVNNINSTSGPITVNVGGKQDPANEPNTRK